MICQHCGIEFAPPHPNTKFCCDEHRAEARRKRMRITAAKSRAKLKPKCSPSMMPRPCTLCGEIFKPNAPNQKVCEKVECRRTINGKVTVDTEAVCSICGATFTLKAGSARATCSPECQAEASSQAQIGRAQKEKTETKDKPRPESFPCQWPWMTTRNPEYPRMDCPECDPMTNRMCNDGLWVDWVRRKHRRKEAA